MGMFSGVVMGYSNVQLLYSDSEAILSDVFGALHDLQNASDFASMRMLRRFVRGSSLRSRRVAVVTPFARRQERFLQPVMPRHI